MKNNRKPLYLQFHDLLFEFQRVQRFAAVDLGVEHDQLGESLSHTEESVLFVLDAGAATNVKDLSEQVGLERSWMSRLVSGLEEKGLLISRPDPEDRRSKILTLTKEGEKQLLTAEQSAKEILNKSFAPLSKTKQNELEKLLAAFADGLGAADFKQHRASHKIGYQLGRISAVIGIYGKGLFGTEVSNTQLHILLILEQYTDNPLQITDIDRAVSFDMSTVSRTVQSLVDDQIIEKTKGIKDKRSVSLVLSAAGKKHFTAYREQALKVISRGLDPLTDTQLDRLIELYRELTVTLPKPGPLPAKPMLTIRPIEKITPKQSTRSVILNRLQLLAKKEGKHRHIGAYKGNKLIAAVGAEYSTQDGTLSSLTLINDGANPSDCRALVDECLK